MSALTIQPNYRDNSLVFTTSSALKLRQMCDFLGKCSQIITWSVTNYILTGTITDEDICDRIVVGSFTFDCEDRVLYGQPHPPICFTGASAKTISDALSNMGKMDSVIFKINITGCNLSITKCQKNKEHTNVIGITILESSHQPINLVHVAKAHIISGNCFSTMCREIKATHCITVSTVADVPEILFTSPVSRVVFKDTQNNESENICVETKSGLLIPWKKTISQTANVEISLSTINMCIFSKGDGWEMKMCCRILNEE